MNATERFKALLANALERICVLEAENEELHARVAEFENGVAAQVEEEVR